MRILNMYSHIWHCARKGILLTERDKGKTLHIIYELHYVSPSGDDTGSISN